MESSNLGGIAAGGEVQVRASFTIKIQYKTFNKLNTHPPLFLKLQQSYSMNHGWTAAKPSSRPRR